MIRLDPRVVEACPPGALDETIRRTLGSVKYEFVPDACAIRLLGPDMSYHELDRDLPAALHTRRGPDGAESLAGSYTGSSCPEAVLRDLPAGTVVVHIDLDWFINDFNGNASQAGRVADDAAVALAQRKVTELFAAVAHISSRIEGWIVATSPGFCAAAHWPWLLDEIDRGIVQSGGTA